MQPHVRVLSSLLLAELGQGSARPRSESLLRHLLEQVGSVFGFLHGTCFRDPFVAKLRAFKGMVLKTENRFGDQRRDRRRVEILDFGIKLLSYFGRGGVVWCVAPVCSDRNRLLRGVSILLDLRLRTLAVPLRISEILGDIPSSGLELTQQTASETCDPQH